jgi:hypothetical protein
VPGTRCGARSDASKQGAQIGAVHPVRRCQAPGAEPGRIASKQRAQIGARHPVRRSAPGRMLANRGPKSVPGTRYGARVGC